MGIPPERVSISRAQKSEVGGCGNTLFLMRELLKMRLDSIPLLWVLGRSLLMVSDTLIFSRLILRSRPRAKTLSLAMRNISAIAPAWTSSAERGLHHLRLSHLQAGRGGGLTSASTRRSTALCVLVSVLQTSGHCGGLTMRESGEQTATSRSMMPSQNPNKIVCRTWSKEQIRK